MTTTYECQVKSITGHHQTEADGDEIFLKLNKKKFWPANEKYVQFQGNQSLPINTIIELGKIGERIDIELWEYDNFFSSKQIGTFNLIANEVGGPFNTSLKMASKEYAVYSLEWEVIRKGPKI